MKDRSRCRMLGLALVCCVAAASRTAAQPSDVHQTTQPPSDARYEIVQSELAAKWTFRLDRHTGRIAQLVSTKDEGLAWEDMLMAGLPSMATASKPRFQLFTSGIAARHTFLIDTRNRCLLEASKTGE